MKCLKITRKKKWYFVWGVFFCSLIVLLHSSFASAIDFSFINYYGFQVGGSSVSNCNTYAFDTTYRYSTSVNENNFRDKIFSKCRLKNFIIETTDVTNLGGSYWSTAGQVNLVASRGVWCGAPQALPSSSYWDTSSISVLGVSFLAGGSDTVTVNSKIDTYDTLWYETNSNSCRAYYSTLTVYYSATGHGSGTGNGHFRIFIGYANDSANWLDNSNTTNFYFFENVANRPTVDFGTALDTVILNTISGNQKTQITQEDMDRTSYNAIVWESQSDSDVAARDATTLGNLLIGNFSTLISTLVSVPALSTSTCYIGPLKYDDHVIVQRSDLCTFPLPTVISTVGSICLIFLLVPCGVNLCRRMINLYDEFVR